MSAVFLLFADTSSWKVRQYTELRVNIFIELSYHVYKYLEIQSNSGLDRLVVKVSRSHTHTYIHTHTHPVEFPFTSDQLNAYAAIYMTNIRETSMRSAGLEPVIPQSSCS